MKLKEVVLIAFIAAVLITSSYNVLGAQPINFYCYDNGKVIGYRTGDLIGNVHARAIDGAWFDILGTWSKDGRRMKFETGDMVLMGKALYEIRVEDSNTGMGLGSTKVLCPDFRVSCKIMDIEIEECKQLKTKDDYYVEYYIRFKAKNIVADDMSYYVLTKDRKTYSWTPIAKSNELISFNVAEISPETYVASFKLRKEVKSFSISHNYCDSRNDPYYTYVTKVCAIERCSSDDDCKSTEYCNDENVCEELDCDYCSYEHNCLKLGDAVLLADTAYFCNVKGLWQSQKIDNKPCANSYECMGECINSLCITPVIITEAEEDINKTQSVVETPSFISSFSYIFKIGGIMLLIVLLLVGSFKYALPAVGRYSFDLETNKKDTMLRRINDFVDEKIMEEKARLHSSR